MGKGREAQGVITQNIDGLHQAAGSKNVLELHGSTLRNYCEKCGKFYDVSYIKHSQGVPRCTCGGRIKPDVVLYEEGLDEKTLYRAVEYIQEADVLIIAGTSLAVYPAAGLVRYYRGHKLVVINKTPLDRGLGADLVITGAVGERSRSFNTKKMPEKFGKSELFRHFSYSKFFYYFSQKKVDIWPILGL